MALSRTIAWLSPGLLTVACSSGTPVAVPDGPPTRSNIRHVVLVVQENHTFDTYFGRYCTAATGSNPTCNTGPACCEAAPATDPSGAMPVVLDDTVNGGWDPDHTQVCETLEMHNGAMDRYTSGATTLDGTSCSNPGNFALAAPATVSTYTGYAQRYALADRYFQPIIGQSSSNDMYFARAQEVFIDNMVSSTEVGASCGLVLMTHTYTDLTSGDLLLNAGFRFATYNEGLGAIEAADGGCPLAPRDCPGMIGIYPCLFDPGDEPFSYYQHFVNNSQYIKDLTALHTDIAAGTLPHFAFIRGIGYHSEHPGLRTTISAGQSFVDSVVQMVLGSPYAQDTLILVTWDEGGGFFDHVSPPPGTNADGQSYGTRVPFFAIGHFARQNYVSHVPMEHSSIVKFLEWNFTQSTGQLSGRDTTVNNIGSLLDPATTGVAVPVN